MNFKSFSLLFCSTFVLQTSVSAGVFKCVKKNGAVYYNDKPCTSGLKEKKVTLDKVPSTKIVRKNNAMAVDSNKNQEGAKVETMKSPMHFNPADQAMYLKKQQDAMRKHELSVDDGSYEMTAAEKKSMKILQAQQAKAEAEIRRKEAIKQAKAKERNRLALIEQEKRAKQTRKALAKDNANKRISDYKEYMESKERSGAMMTEEERDWRNLDAEDLVKEAKYHDNVNRAGTKAYKDRQQSLRAAGFAEQRHMKHEREFNNAINQHR